MLIWLGDKVAGPAIVAVVFAGVTSFVLERIRFKRDVLTKLSDQLRADLTELQVLVMEYYGRGRDNEKDPSIEAQIVVLDQEVTDGLRLYSTEARNMRSAPRLEDMLIDFSLAVMGKDSFQVAGREVDADQQRIALSAIKSVRSMLTEAKLRKIKSLPQFEDKHSV